MGKPSTPDEHLFWPCSLALLVWPGPIDSRGWHAPLTQIGEVHRAGRAGAWGSFSRYNAGDLQAECLRVHFSGGNPRKARHKVENSVWEISRLKQKYNEGFLQTARYVNFANHVIRRKSILRAHERH